MMRRLNKARQVGSSEPEATWRAGFDLVADAEERIEAVIRSLASVAVLFGLAGTVLGFARLAGPLLAIQRGASSISISSELSGAFLATLAGILGATMILLGAVPMLRSAEETWLSAVEDVGRLVLVPSLPRPLTKIGDVVLEELKRKLDAVRDAWVSVLVEPARHLSSLASSAQASVGKLGEALSGIGPETLKELASSARSMKTSANSIAKSSAYYESSIVDLGKVSAALGGTLGDLKGALIDNNSRVERMEQTLAGAREEVERQGEALAASLNSMASEFGSLEASVLKRMEQESGIFDKAGQTVEAVEEHLKQLAKGAQELFSSARNVTLAASALKDAVTPLPTDLATALDKWLTMFQREEGALFSQMRDSLAEVSLNLTKASAWIATTAQSQSTGAQIRRFTDDLDTARSVGTAGPGKAGSGGSPTEELPFHDEEKPLAYTEKPRAAQIAAPHVGDQGRPSSSPMQRDEPDGSLPPLSSSGMPAVDVTTAEVRDSSGGTRPELERDNDRNSLRAARYAPGKLDDANERAGSVGEETRSPKIAEPARRGLFAWLRRALR